MSAVATPNLDTISLYYKEGTSDKEYHLAVLGNDESGWQVQYRYGRRGSALKTAFKNKVPTDYVTAKSLYTDMLKKQLAQGYTPGEDGVPYSGTDKAGELSGLHPQLLNFIDEEMSKTLLNADSWIMQEKKDGVRCMIRKQGKVITASNKKGIVMGIPVTVEEAIKAACGEANAIMDGELVGEVFWIFDLLAVGVHALQDRDYRSRLNMIDEWFSDNYGPNFKLVPTAIGTASKKALYKKLKSEKAEGVVFSDATAPYKPGRPNSGGTRVKDKFFTSATVRVKKMNLKNSFRMEMLSKGDWVEVGDCTYFETKDVPKPGEFVEVRYLYMKKEGGSLYGPPVLLSIRKDVDEDDCLISQVKYKQSDTEEEES